METLTENKTINPFPGLRAFTEAEKELFFGRDREIEDILPILKENHFLALVGNSGSGKTSLVHSGLIPVLREGYDAKADSHWEIISFRPGDNPIQDLALSLQHLAKELDVKMEPTFNAQIQELARENPDQLEKIFTSFDPNFGSYNLLIVVDQFENLFKTEGIRPTEFEQNARAFVRLLLEVRQQKKLPIYVVAAIRSDFIGHVTEFRGLYEAIEVGQFLLPRMKGESVGKAIIGPIVKKNIPGKIPADITNELLQILLDDYEAEPTDQLPILQHALMRTWDNWQTSSNSTEKIHKINYTDVGMIKNALSYHIKEAYQELTPLPHPTDGIAEKKEKEVTQHINQKICEILFKSLTGLSSENLATQRPVEISRIVELASFIPQKDPKHIQVIDEDRVKKVVDIFLRLGRSFLASTSGNDIRQNHGGSILTISHESLIRRWSLLLEWVEEESESALVYHKLIEATEEYHENYDGQGEEGLYKNPRLQMALNWEQENNPNGVWAERYHPNYQQAMAFLRKSEKAHLDAIEKKKREQERRLKRAQFMNIIFMLLAVVAGLGFIIAGMMATNAYLSKNEAVEQGNLAQQSAYAAFLDQKKAEAAAEDAKYQEAIATRQTNIATIKAEEARKAKDSAEHFLEIAITARIEAEENEIEANNQRRKAVFQKDRADSSIVVALDQSKLARSLQRRSLAQAVAARSQRVDSAHLQAMLAKQAYEFNKKQAGDHPNVQFNLYDPIIYNSLHQALAKLKGDDYNSLQVREKNLHFGVVRGMAILPVDKNFAPKKTYETLFTTSGDGKIFSLGTDLTKYDSLLTPRDSTLLPVNKRFLLPPKLYKHLALSSNKRWVAVAGDGPDMYFISTKNPTVRPLNSIQKPKKITFEENTLKITVHRGRGVWDIAPFQNGKYAGFITTGGDERVEFQSLSGNSFALISPAEPFTCIAISPDSKFLAGGTESGTVYIWEFESQLDLVLNPVKRLVQENGSPITKITYTSSSNELITGHENGVVQLWNLSDQTYSKRIDHKAAITDLVFKPSVKGDLSMIATSSYDNTTRLYLKDQFKNNNYLPIILGGDELPWATSLAFGVNSQYLWVGYKDGIIKRWEINPENIAAQLCDSLMDHSLTRKEWDRYIEDDALYNNYVPCNPKNAIKP